MDRRFQLSDRVHVLFEAVTGGYSRPTVVVDGESRRIPLIFYPELEASVERWLKAVEGLSEPLNLSYGVVAGALLYAQKHPEVHHGHEDLQEMRAENQHGFL